MNTFVRKQAAKVNCSRVGYLLKSIQALKKERLNRMPVHLKGSGVVATRAGVCRTVTLNGENAEEILLLHY